MSGAPPLAGTVRTGGGSRPVVLLVSGEEPATTEELARGLARAGFAAVSWERAARGTEDIGRVRDALFAGVLGVPATSFVLLGEGRGGRDAVLYAATDVRVRALVTLDAELGDAAATLQDIPCSSVVLTSEGRDDARESPALARAEQPHVTVRLVPRDSAVPGSSTRDPDRALRIIVDWLAHQA